MFQRFLEGVRKSNSIFSIYNPISRLKGDYFVKSLGFINITGIRYQSSNNITQHLSENVENLPLKEINSLIKESLYNKYKIEETSFDKILFKLINNSQDRILSLDTLYYLLLLNPQSVSFTECVSFIDTFRLSTDSNEQLKLLNIFYAIQFYHSHIQSHYTPQIENYVKYLKLFSHKIKLKCGIDEETNEIKQLKKTLDDLNVEYLSAITGKFDRKILYLGHIYSPIVLKGTNMTIDIEYERHKNNGTKNLNPIIALKELIMKEMGWRVRFIPIDEWKSLESDKQRKTYISKFINKFYVETQFIKNPSWVSGFWETEFVKNSKSMPSIEIKLAPPENPLPQVEDEVKLLESNRIQLEEGMMSRLEQEYNNALMYSKEKIKEVINNSLSVFDNKELIVELLSKYTHKAKNKNHDKSKFHANNVSFLQMDQNYVPSSVRVMMSEVEPPDPAIKEKMEQIEQARNDEEIHAFYQESKEFEQLTQVTLVELQKMLQLQLNPYLLETEKIKETLHEIQANKQMQYTNPISFIQTQATNLSDINQLNVKIGQSDKPYPTVDDYVMNMEKKRDVAEKLARNRILNMYLNLMKAQHEMIADELHVAVSRIISQYSGIVEEANKGVFNKKQNTHEEENKLK